MKNIAIEKAAELQYFISNVLNSALKEIRLSEQARKIQGYEDCETYYDLWRKTMSDKFFDMLILIRTASAVEFFLRDCYMKMKDYKSIVELLNDPHHKRGIFQRILPWQSDGAISIFKKFGIDLNQFSDFQTIQELMLLRHLYSHNLGLVDDDFLERYKKLKGQDLTPYFRQKGYPDENVFWFKPLRHISEFIDIVRNFSKWLAEKLNTAK